MRRAIPIYIVCICAIVAACKTSHRVRESSSISTHIDRVEQSRSDKQLETSSARSVIDMLLSSTEIRERITLLSAPDSAGRQHPVAIADRTIKSAAERTTKTDSAGVQRLDESDTSAVQLRADSTATMRRQAKTTHDSRPTWLIPILILALIIVIIFTIKRLKS